MMNELIIKTLTQDITILREQLSLLEFRASEIRQVLNELEQQVQKQAEQQRKRKEKAELLQQAEQMILPSFPIVKDIPEVADEDTPSSLAAFVVEPATNAQEQEDATTDNERATEIVEDTVEAQNEEHVNDDSINETNTTIDEGPWYGGEELSDITEAPADEKEDKEEQEEKIEQEDQAEQQSHHETKSTLLPPIDDIRKAISLGDRFLFQRELFKGDGEKMQKTIDQLNSFKSLEDALKYINKHFDWDKESQAYEIITTLLQRRYS